MKRLLPFVQPPLWLLLILNALCIAALSLIFSHSCDRSPIAYICYVLSAYTLTADVCFCILTLPNLCRTIRERAYRSPLYVRFGGDRIRRTHTMLFLSFALNLSYAALNSYNAWRVRSAWFVMLAVYALLLALMRFLLLRRFRTANHVTALRRARLCAMLLLTLNLTLTGAVLMILTQGHGFAYRGYLIYAVAVYTFYAVIHAIVGLVRFRRTRSPLLSAAKAVSLSSALVSMLNLETAMLAQFGADTPPAVKRTLIAASGGGISAMILTLAIVMFVRTTREINASRKESLHGKRK